MHAVPVRAAHGAYPLRANDSRGVWGPAPIDSPLLVEPDTLTIADVFKKSGYRTSAFGKWHLGFKTGKNDWQVPLRPGPQDLGFDHYFGMPVVNSAPPYVYVENDRLVGSDPADPLVHLGRNAKGPVPLTPIPPEAGNRSPNQFAGAEAAHARFNDYEVGTKLAEKSVEWIGEHKDDPFFLYLSMTNIHHPFTPAERFRGTSETGLYGDAIHELEWIVGEVLACLDDHGLAEDTLVIFTSDISGMFNIGGQAAFRAGHRQNGDLLGFKFGVWEGGHRVPLIARWPGRIPAGTTSDQLLGNVDFLATFAALTGVELTDDRRADSVNVLPALVGEPEQPLRDHLLLAPHKRSHLSLRLGDWMCIPSRGSGGFGGRRPGDHTFSGPPAASFVGSENSDIENGRIKPDAPPAQLYGLAADRSQTQNVLRKHPDVVAKMEALLDEYRSASKENAARRGGPEKPADPAAKRTSQKKPVPSDEPTAAADVRALQRPAETKPNVVVIFADDLGYGDLSCYRPAAAETPQIDALAAAGFRSTDFFVPANVCSPSRASLLTGRYPMRCGLPVARNENVPKYRHFGLAPEELTIPELLKPAGYRSLMVGKWHLGMGVSGSHPLDAGFDEHLGIPSNCESKRGSDHDTLYRGRTVVQNDVPFKTLTKRYTEEVVDFIARRKDEPFFIYVSHHIAHNPIVPRDKFLGTSGQGRYGDFVKELDHSTGRILAALREAGLEENTVVVFTSDNGPTRNGSSGGLAGGKYCTMEGGHRVPAIFRWPGTIPPGQVSDVTLTSMDLLPTICRLAGVTPPEDRTLDGRDAFPTLLGQQSETPHEALAYYNGTNLQAVREGDWKLHLPRTAADQPFWSKRPAPGKGFVTLAQPRLYHLGRDVGERHDVSGENPDIVARLQKRAELFRTDLGDVHVHGADQRAIDLVDPQER
uniref:sulfatase-like hydrolase/transferase n=1 Tax=Alienimonas californiensis TaxID=2527989 RepID=UPI001F601FD6|nr:sulfatase-like hydrolase/transferase [Alienimonas californiensis]